MKVLVSRIKDDHWFIHSYTITKPGWSNNNMTQNVSVKTKLKLKKKKPRKKFKIKWTNARKLSNFFYFISSSPTASVMMLMLAGWLGWWVYYSFFIFCFPTISSTIRTCLPACLPHLPCPQYIQAKEGLMVDRAATRINILHSQAIPSVFMYITSVFIRTI